MCVCHPWKRPKNVLLGDEEWQKKIKKENIVQPPVSDHPKCKGLVVAYGRWSGPLWDSDRKGEIF